MTSTISPVFKPIIVASQIEEAVINTLQYWYPTYLQEIANQLGISNNSLPSPKNYTNRNSFDAEKGESVPKIVVIAPGLLNAPLQKGGGDYTAVWRLGVGVAAAGKDEQSANLRVKSYAAGARAILLQQQSLNEGLPGIAQITWQDESYDDLAIPNQHQLYKAANLFFAVDIEQTVNRWAGPTFPLPYVSDYGVVEDVIIDIEQEEVTD